jgi:hypothetical protein
MRLSMNPGTRAKLDVGIVTLATFGVLCAAPHEVSRIDQLDGRAVSHRFLMRGVKFLSRARDC